MGISRMTSAVAAIAFLLSSHTAVAAQLRYAEDQAPGIVHPMFTSTMSEARLNELLFEGLFTDDPELKAVPDLASSARVSADGLEMTIELRSDVTWHDSQSFTADDVVFTVNAMKDKGTLSTEKGRVAWIKSIEAEGPSTLHLTFEHPEAAPADKLMFKILPKHAFESTALKRTDPFRTNPVGTGPYQLASYNDDNSITLDAYPDWHGSVKIPDIVMREVSDKNYQAKLLLYESLEALVRVLPRDLAVLQNNRKVELYPYQTNSWWYLGFNETRKPWNNHRVREAIAHLLDVPSLLAPIGTGDVLSGPYVKSSPFYNHEVQAWRHDAGTAAHLLEEAGFSKDGASWSLSGQPLTIALYAHQTLESSQEVVINLQSQLRGGGVRVDVKFLDDADWKARIWRERDFDMILSQWTFDRNEDIRDQFHSAGARNFTGFENAEVDALLDRARDTIDPQVKKSALRDVHRIVHDDIPMVFLWTLDSYAALSVKVRNVLIHPFYFFTYVQNWSMS
jgi:peptide/nickel transport system substrate-binding protein